MENYEMKTTFWNDFTIADSFGKDAIKDTYERAFGEWKIDYVYLTELVMVLNWKCWEHYENGNEEFAELYMNLYTQADQYALDNLKGEKLSYFYNVTD